MVRMKERCTQSLGNFISLFFVIGMVTSSVCHPYVSKECNHSWNCPFNGARVWPLLHALNDFNYDKGGCLNRMKPPWLNPVCTLCVRLFRCYVRQIRCQKKYLSIRIPICLERTFRRHQISWYRRDSIVYFQRIKGHPRQNFLCLSSFFLSNMLRPAFTYDCS